MKESLSAHLEANTSLPLSTDYLFHLTCNEGAAASNLVDDLGARTMTQTASPGLAGSAAQNTPTTGARTFNGTTQYAGRAAADADHTMLQGEYGVAFWMKRNNATSVVLEYAEHGATSATNVQVSVRVFNGQVQFQWERGAGVLSAVALFDTPLGAWCHVGIGVRVDPEEPGFRLIEGYLNGARVIASRGGHLPPDGGSSARWIVGASRHRGTGIGVPGAFFAGELDDVIVTKWAPDVAWFRAQYARGKRDWSKPHNARMMSTHVRVLVNGAGPYNFTPTKFQQLGPIDVDWIDLTSVLVNGDHRVDFLSKPVEWSDSIDDLVTTARFSVFARWRFFNMSPFTGAAGFDAHNPLAAGDEHLLSPMRRVRIETAICPPLMRRDQVPSWAWEVQFDGFIRSVDVAGDEVNVACADLGSALMDVFIEPSLSGDRTYGAAGSIAVQTELNEILVDNDPSRFEVAIIDDNGAGNAIVITTALTGDGTINGSGKLNGLAAGDRFVITGTANFNTPAGTSDVVASSTSTTITAVRTTAGAFPAESIGVVSAARINGYKGAETQGTPQVWVPVSPAWNVYEWNEPASKSVLQALDDIVSQNIGWRVRYRWHEARQESRLCLYNPVAFPGAGILADGSNYTIEPVLDVRRMSQHVDDTRNAWAVEYYRDAAKDPQGNRTIYIAASVDLTSVRRYGRRYARINVGSDSLVTRSNEASTVAGIARADLSQPIAELDAETFFDDRVQIGDLLIIVSEMASDTQAPKYFDADTLEGSIVNIGHSVGRGVHRTKIGARSVSGFLNQPVARAARYDEVIAQVGSLPGRGLSAPATPAGLAVVSLGALPAAGATRWARATWTAPAGDKNSLWTKTEVHHSLTNGFSPTSGTLVAVVGGTQAVFSTSSAAGVTLYVRIVHCDRLGNRSAASTQVAYVT